MLQPGDEIDIWVVEYPLGQGGMGSVYRCHNRSAKRILAAIKTLDPSLSRVSSAKARFVREAEILFALDHPNIVKVRNVRMDAELPYIEMEFVSGHSLEAQILRGPTGVEQALALFKQAASALKYMHGMGVRHRDIKPSNAIIQDSGVLKLVDFGIATEADGQTLSESGQTFGSVSYAPPEWIEPGHLDPILWDIYSLGTVFYEMLTGRFAFPVAGVGTSRQKALQVILSKQQHPPLDPGPTLPVDLRRLVRAMTRSEYQERTPTAADVLAALEKVDLSYIDSQAEFDDTPVEPKSSPTWYPGMDLDAAPAPTPIPLERAAQRSADLSESPAGTPDSGLAAPSAPPPAPPPREPADGVLADSVPADTAPARVRDERADTVKKLVLVGFFLALIAVMAGLGWQVYRTDPARNPPEPLPTPGRALDVVIAGLAADTPVQVSVSGMPPESAQGFVHHWAPLPTGPQRVSALIGPECVVSSPGPWCSVVEQELEVFAGQGVQTLTLTLTPPELREFAFKAPRGSALVLDGQALELDRKGQGKSSVFPGQYELQASRGECPESAQGCSETQSCPPGCSSLVLQVTVPLEGELPVVEVNLPEPKRATQDTRDDHSQGAQAGDPRVKDGQDEPRDAAPPATAGAARAQVTNAQLGAWLAKHPEWQRQAAIDAGRAGSTYLKGWQDATPPSGKASQAAVNVSWSMARAYCSGRGGLASVSASPNTWSEGPSLAWHEYRQADGKPAWVRSDGSSSTAVKSSDAKAFIGFRCAR